MRNGGCRRGFPAKLSEKHTNHRYAKQADQPDTRCNARDDEPLHESAHVSCMFICLLRCHELQLPELGPFRLHRLDYRLDLLRHDPLRFGQIVHLQKLGRGHKSLVAQRPPVSHEVRCKLLLGCVMKSTQVFVEQNIDSSDALPRGLRDGLSFLRRRIQHCIAYGKVRFRNKLVDSRDVLKRFRSPFVNVAERFIALSDPKKSNAAHGYENSGNRKSDNGLSGFDRECAHLIPGYELGSGDTNCRLQTVTAWVLLAHGMPALFARDNDLIQRMFNEGFMIVRTNIERA